MGLSLTASNGAFLVKIDEKDMKILKYDKSKQNTILIRCTYMYKDFFQNVSWFITCINVGAADKNCC